MADLLHYTFRMWVSSRNLYIGLGFALPFLICNALVAMQASFFLSLLRPSGGATSYELPLVLILIELVGVGGLVALSSLLKERRLYMANALVGVAFVAFALFGGYELGKDVYHCDILKIPNCD